MLLCLLPHDHHRMFSLKDTLWGGADLAELLHPDAAAVSRPGVANHHAASRGLGYIVSYRTLAVDRTLSRGMRRRTPCPLGSEDRADRPARWPDRRSGGGVGMPFPHAGPGRDVRSRDGICLRAPKMRTVGRATMAQALPGTEPSSRQPLRRPGRCTPWRL